MAMIEAGTPPERILSRLGIIDPKDLDIEAIAYACGATILYEPLTGCEATILGHRDKAIITVNRDGHPGRRRFSAGHELGHWMNDRGKSAFGCLKSEITASWSGTNLETKANQYASDLLLPLSMFVPLVRGRPVDLSTLNNMADTFKMSKTATAIKLVKHGSFPAVIAYYVAGRRKWFIPQSVPGAFSPHLQLGDKTLAAGLTEVVDQGVNDTRADHWCSHPTADRYYVRESCFRVGPGSIVAILWWEDERQLIDFEEEQEERSSRRSDFRSE